MSVAAAAAAAMMTLALVSPPATGAGDCNSAGDSFKATLAKVMEALRTYEQCISESKGKDKCAAEMQALDDAHEDFEDAVNDYKQACP